MKKILAILSICCLTLSFIGCSQAEPVTSSGPFIETTSEFYEEYNSDFETETSSKASSKNYKPSTPTSSKPSAQKPSAPITQTPGSPSHQHQFSNATCTTPKKCSCGATEGSALGHSFASATCSTPKKCTVCGITEGSKGEHKYSSGKCTVCGAADANYVKTYNVGETWIVDGKFELKINSVIKHNICNDSFKNSGVGNSNSATTAVLVNYSYKNLGSEKLKIYEYDFEVYDEKGSQGDNVYFEHYCKHRVEATNCITNGTCDAKLPVSIVNESNSVTIYVEVDDTKAKFVIPVTEPTAEDKEAMVEYSRVSGEFTYKYNNYVGNRGDDGTKVLFIPKNTELKTKDNKGAMMLGASDRKFDNGIFLEVCDGYGKFDTGIEYIPAGEYIVVVVSKNTRNSGQMTTETLKSRLGNYISDADLETLALFIGFNKCAIDDMELKAGYEHTISNHFGVTYF